MCSGRLSPHTDRRNGARWQVAKVHRGNLDFVGDTGEGLQWQRLSGGRNGDARPGGGEGADSFESDAGIAAESQWRYGRKVDALHHLKRCAFRVET